MPAPNHQPAQGLPPLDPHEHARRERLVAIKRDQMGVSNEELGFRVRLGLSLQAWRAAQAVKGRSATDAEAERYYEFPIPHLRQCDVLATAYRRSFTGKKGPTLTRAEVFPKEPAGPDGRCPAESRCGHPDSPLITLRTAQLICGIRDPETLELRPRFDWGEP